MRWKLGLFAAVLVAGCSGPSMEYSARFEVDPDVTSATIDGLAITPGFQYATAFDSFNAAMTARIPIVLTTGSGTMRVDLTPSGCSGGCTQSGSYACDSITSENESFGVHTYGLHEDSGGCVFAGGEGFVWGNDL